MLSFGRVSSDPDDRARVLKQLGTCLQAQTVFRCDYRLLGNDGATHWFYDEAKLFREVRAELVWRGCMLEISARKRAEEDCRRLCAELQRQQQRPREERHDALTGVLSRASFWKT